MDREEEIEINAYSVFVQDKGWCARVQEKELERLGYRKADEVRKETAKEIIQKTYDMYKKYGIGKLLLWANALAAEYGVEVKE